MNDSTAAMVRSRAGNRCEYCQMHQSLQGATFHVEHISPRASGGLSTPDNLAWLLSFLQPAQVRSDDSGRSSNRGSCGPVSFTTGQMGRPFFMVRIRVGRSYACCPGDNRFDAIKFGSTSPRSRRGIEVWSLPSALKAIERRRRRLGRQRLGQRRLQLRRHRRRVGLHADRQRLQQPRRQPLAVAGRELDGPDCKRR